MSQDLVRVEITAALVLLIVPKKNVPINPFYTGATIVMLGLHSRPKWSKSGFKKYISALLFYPFWF